MRVESSILRNVLETVEAAPDGELLRLPPRSDVSVREQTRHVQLLIDGGYLTGQQLQRYRPAFALGLTISGQRMLNEMRSGSSVGKSVGECAQRVVTNVAVALLTAKAHAAGIGL